MQTGGVGGKASWKDQEHAGVDKETRSELEEV